MSARLQAWLQRKPWPIWRLGNAVANIRYAWWNLKGGKW